MIEFHYETDFELQNEVYFADWITRVITGEGFSHGKIDYIFCSDNYLFRLNEQFLNHDTFTDIITFDYSKGKELSGDIFISVDRIRDNAENLKVPFNEEVLRVMAHGILHLVGYNDKTREERRDMREKENEKIKLFHVEQ